MIITPKTHNKSALKLKLAEPERHYRQGDIVAGTVVIHPTKHELSFDAISLQLKGYIQTRSEDGTHCHQACFLSIDKNLDANLTNLPSQGKSKAFHANQVYRYPFEFELPIDVPKEGITARCDAQYLKLPPSFEIATSNVVGTYASIHYVVEAAILSVNDREQTSYFQGTSGASYGIAGGLRSNPGSLPGSANNSAPSSPGTPSTMMHTSPIRKVSVPILVVPNYHPHTQANLFKPGLLQQAEAAGDSAKAHAKFKAGDVQLMGITSMNKIPIIKTYKTSSSSTITVPLNIRFTPEDPTGTTPEVVSISAKLQAYTVISHEIPQYLWSSQHYDPASGKPVPRQSVAESSRNLLHVSQKIRPAFALTDKADKYTVNFALCIPDKMKKSLVPSFNFASISHGYRLKFYVTFANRVIATVAYPVIVSGYAAESISAFPSSASLMSLNNAGGNDAVSIPVDVNAQSTKFVIGSGLPEYEHDDPDSAPMSRNTSGTNLASLATQNSAAQSGHQNSAHHILNLNHENSRSTSSLVGTLKRAMSATSLHKKKD
ncbi:hypothetical protein B0I72DRAFT_141024 [Yarrowia lipolytica]|jgi:hypothetical protein|uniref:YALI0E03718p n=2 Tax=Yarrowia lipolytica TaxID=4952 RepID=Q6C752_YARLI|nr:YALI0E03718p [Yarrowia lipolytica CLIB122]AOW04909.1 hypothetical protein YALI1_E04499g [Yarrowia lipolytica]KAB8286262.1 hypothetical protein BKA91DRAFT_132187 [Yarrowia lipolytica]KAE8174684.1 hypothetical protein BKA90DRAFT_133811 [Yarrowia lipolytica]KAJ8056488.1 hypothetical protein LXG23DRAFT_45988 [Yarrowia lipolytica]QNP98769.1 Hypothetical protein YALI2_E00085g [Yarrowia lipolytica]|eukprot:XP_503510.1 YALI0E03718p [Yarrowia lipolytica CLIB122]